MAKPRPMHGIHVVDFTSMMAGPVATRLLADCGADVIKVEPPSGDYMRARSPLRQGRSSYYGQMNAGKRSIALDLKTAGGRDVALRLIARADVVVENFRPGVMKSFGLDYASVREANPDLVYCSISGFGQVGTRIHKPAYAPIIHAASGFDLAHLRYNEEQEKPAKTGIFTADVISAVYAFGAIQTALLQRERQGGGQHVDVSLLDSMLNMLVYEIQEAQFPTPERRPIYSPMRASDGFVVVAPVNQKNFDNLLIVVGHPEWATDPRFSSIRAREDNWTELMTAIEEWTSTRPAVECEEAMTSAGVPCSRYLNVREWLADAELHANGSFAEVSDSAGAFLVPNAPFRLSEAAVNAGAWVADTGEHTEAILRDVLGLDGAETARLMAEMGLPPARG